MDTEVDVPNANLVLIPGMYAEVDLTLESHPGVLAVPVPAVETGADETSGQVMVVTAQNHVEICRVQLGLQTATRIEIRSGLKAGDLVVVGARAGLQPGQTVQPKLTTVGEN